MSEEDALREALQDLSIPELPDTVRERALYRAKIALHAHEIPFINSSRNASHWLGWAFAGLAAVALIFSYPRQKPAQPPPLQAGVLAQMELLFPGQVQAIVSRGAQYELTLSDQPSAPLDQPISVQFRKGQDTISVATYSGRNLSLNLEGTEVCLEVLLSADGQVILSNDRFFWTGSPSSSLEGYHIQAKPLPPST